MKALAGYALAVITITMASPAAAGDASKIPIPLTPMQEDRRQAELAERTKPVTYLARPIPGSAVAAPPYERFDRAERR